MGWIFQPGTLFMFCGRKNRPDQKHLYGKVMNFYSVINELGTKAVNSMAPVRKEVCSLSQQFQYLMEGLTIKPKKCIQKIDHPFHPEHSVNKNIPVKMTLSRI